MKLEIYLKDQDLICEYTSVLGVSKSYCLTSPGDDFWPVHSKTCTSDMKDCIGNIKTEFPNGLMRFHGYFRGEMRDIIGVPLEPLEINQRCMATEHIDINGEMRIVLTKQPILQGNGSSAINFINFGWSNDKLSHMMRVDIYTGQSTLIDSTPFETSWKPEVKV